MPMFRRARVTSVTAPSVTTPSVVRRRAATVPAAVCIAALLAAGSCSKGTGTEGSGPGASVAPAGAVARTNDDTAGDPKPGGKLVYGLGAETDGWNPWHNRFAGSSYTVANTFYDLLFMYDPAGEPQPYLAEKAVSSADFKEWTITLRPGVSFHNAEKLDAAAVKANWEVGRTSPLVGAAFSGIKEITGAEGSLEVKVTMNQPWSTFLHTLTAQLGYLTAPSRLAADGGKATAVSRDPIGTGPFKFDSWVDDNVLKVSRAPNYWRKEHPAYLDSIDFRIIADQSGRTASLLAGDLDVMETSDPQALIKFRAESPQTYQYFTNQSSDADETFIGLNTSKPPFNDPLARQILAYGVDTASLSASAYQSEFSPARGPFQQGSPKFVETDYPRYDIAKAQTLHEEYKKKSGGIPLKFSALIPPGIEYQAIAQSLQAQALESGIEVTIVGIEQTQLILKVLSGDYEATGFILFGSPSLDREYVFIASPPVASPGISLNFTRNKNDTLIKAMDDARATSDVEKQRGLYGIVQKEMAKDLAFIFLVHNRSAVVATKNVHGLTKPTLPGGKPAQISLLPTLYEVWKS